MARQTGGTPALAATVTSRGGVARVRSLIDEGWSRYDIACALEKGGLTRVRRDWIAAVGADAEVIAAARAGVVLTCITEARRRGLWVLGEDDPHVAAAPHARGGKPVRAHVHWGAPLVPRHPDALVDRVENVLGYVAGCQPLVAALTVWESALRQGVVGFEQLAALPLSTTARALLDRANPLSDSGLETIFFVRLAWLRVRILPQIWIHGHRVDFLIGERLVVQVDGGHHVGAQRAADVAHDALLVTLGYHVLRFTYAQIVHDWPAVQDLIARAVAARRHSAS